MSQAGYVPAAVPTQPNHGKPVVRVELESAAWLVQITVWNSGEAELETIRMLDNTIVNKHYDLTSRDDLNALLDELVRLLHNDVPDAAVVYHAPGPPARQGNTAPRVSSDRVAPTATRTPRGHRPGRSGEYS